MNTWKGLNLNSWAQVQTLSPRQFRDDQGLWSTGYELLSMHWSDMIDEIPLEFRFANFKSRLERAIANHA